MAQKNATLSNAQQESIKAAGLNTLCWGVLKELPSSIIVKHRLTGEVKMIDHNPKRLGM